MPDIAETEYVRGKLEERDGATVQRAPSKFDRRGNDVWAERSGRTFFGTLDGAGKDFSSPVVGNGAGMAGLSRLVGGRTRKHVEGKGKGTPDYDTKELLEEGAQQNKGNVKAGRKPKKAESESDEEKKPKAKKKRTNARAQIVARIMRERGVKLIEASKIVKAEGLY